MKYLTCHTCEGLEKLHASRMFEQEITCQTLNETRMRTVQGVI